MNDGVTGEYCTKNCPPVEFVYLVDTYERFFLRSACFMWFCKLVVLDKCEYAREEMNNVFKEACGLLKLTYVDMKTSGKWDCDRHRCSFVVDNSYPGIFRT